MDEIVRVSRRRRYFPVRKTFVQIETDGVPGPGPLAKLVSAGDKRGLLLYLLLLTKASAAPWDSALPSAVWARAMDVTDPASKSARSTISKMWLRLERHGLVARSRRNRLAEVTLLREDGSGQPYTHPGEVGDRYIRVPLAVWAAGPRSRSRWYQLLSLPELTVLLIALSLRDGYWLPHERGPDWYGISADTLSRGADGLERRGLLTVDRTYKPAPLSAIGYSPDFHYTLKDPFGPRRPSGGAKTSK